MCAQVRENAKSQTKKLSDPNQPPGKAPLMAPKIKKRLFAFFNFEIANLKRLFETTKFKNENFIVYNSFFQKLTILPKSQMQTNLFKQLLYSIFVILLILRMLHTCINHAF